jgi:hypothetical protein
MSLRPILVISSHLFLGFMSSLFKRLDTYYSTLNNKLYIIFVYLKANINNLKNKGKYIPVQNMQTNEGRYSAAYS